MADKTGIEWTDATWNPVRGCSRVSEGCRHCYAEVVAARFSGPGLPYEGLAADGKWTGKVRLIPEHLADPLRWRKPRRIFVNSMSDLFHERLSDEEIAAVFGIMVSAPQHTFQVLTKRAARMREWMERSSVVDCIEAAAARVGKLPDFSCGIWPGAVNIWLGVSVEDQETADERIPLLLQTPAAVRFVSYEPALGPVDFTGDGHEYLPDEYCSPSDPPTRLDWIIVGGESGPAARPCYVGWIRRVVEDCRGAGVPCFVKQLGKEPHADFCTCGGGFEHVPHEPFCGKLRIYDPKGGDMAEWPEELRVREFPSQSR